MGKVKEQYDLLASKTYVISGKVLKNDPNVHIGLTPVKEFIEAAEVPPATHDYFPIPSTELNSNQFFD